MYQPNFAVFITLALTRQTFSGVPMAKNIAKTAAPSKRPYLKQSDVPSGSLDDALRIPQAILDHYAGKPTTPLHVAKALNVDPKGSQVRVLLGGLDRIWPYRRWRASRIDIHNRSRSQNFATEGRRPRSGRKERGRLAAPSIWRIPSKLGRQPIPKKRYCAKHP